METNTLRRHLGTILDKVYFPVVSILASFIIAGISFALLGFDLFVAFGALPSGSVCNLFAWGETVAKALHV